MAINLYRTNRYPLINSFVFFILYLTNISIFNIAIAADPEPEPEADVIVNGDDKPRANNLAEFDFGSLFMVVETTELKNNKKSHVWKVAAEEGKFKYFYTPALLPEWSSYSRNVGAYCQSVEEASVLATENLIKQGQDYQTWELLINAENNYEKSVIESFDPIKSTQDDIEKEFLVNHIVTRTLMNGDAKNTIDYFAANDNPVALFAADQPAVEILNNALGGQSQTLEILNNAANSADLTEGNLVSIPLDIELDRPAYKAEILAAIQLIDPSALEHNLLPIPYDLARVLIEINGEKRQIWASDGSHAESYLAVAPGFTKSESFAHDRIVNVSIDASCKEHLQIVGGVKSGKLFVRGEIYRTGTAYDVTSLYLNTLQNLSSKLGLELDTNERTKMEITTAGGSAGISVNFGPIGFSGGKSSASTQQQSYRLISRDVFNEAVKNAVSKSQISCTGDCSSLIKDVMDKMFNENNSVHYLIKDIATNQYGILNNQLGYFTITDSQLSGDLETQLQTANKQAKEGTLKVFEEFEISGKEESAINVNQRVKGKLDANKIPVAVMGDLSLLTQNDINISVNAAIYQRLPTSQESRLYFDFVYPAYGYSLGRIHDYQTSEEKLEEAIAAAKLLENCTAEEQVLSVYRTASGSATDRAHKPEARTGPVMAVARAGYYIDAKSIRAVDTGHYSNGFRRQSINFHEKNVRNADQKNQMVSSVVYKGTCSRSRTHRSKTKSCRASGYINWTEIPLTCAPHVVEGYGG